MKGIDVARLILICILTTQTENAQSRAYAKFGPAGETIGLFNLLKGAGTCGEWRKYSGTVGETRITSRNRTVTYRFALRTNLTSVRLGFALDQDEIPSGDVRNLLSGTHRVAVRACRRGNRDWVWEITKV